MAKAKKGISKADWMSALTETYDLTECPAEDCDGPAVTEKEPGADGEQHTICLWCWRTFDPSGREVAGDGE